MKKTARKIRSSRQARLTAAVVEAFERRAYLSVSFANQAVYPVGSSPSAVNVVDLNGDGNLDIVTANYGGSISVLLGNGDGTFQSQRSFADGLSAGGSLTDMAVGNFDSDADVALVNGTDQLAVLASNGDGTFGPPQLLTLANNAKSIAIGRLTGGEDDMVVGYSNNSIGVILANGDGTFQSPKNITVGSNAVTSVSIGDINGDGHADIAVSDKDGSIDVLLGNGDGTFQTPTAAFTSIIPQYGLGITDLNGDGKADLFFGGSTGTITALLGNGDGTFRSPITFSDPNIDDGFISDLTGNGKQDRIATNFSTDSVEIALANGDGTFAPPVNFQVGNTPDAIAVGDFNNDGKPDIVVTNLGDSTISVLLNTNTFPSGTLFQAPTNVSTESRPEFVASGDLNKDGHADLAVANRYSESVQVFLGNGDGTFQTPRTYTGFYEPVSIAIADVNGDGNPDLVVVNGSNETVSVLLGNGNGSFKAPDNYPLGVPSNMNYSDQMALDVTDVNGDGRPDIIVADPKDGDFIGLLNNGDGTFKAAKVYNIGGYPSSLAVADLNGDGKVDLLVGDKYSNTIDLLLGNGNGTFKVPTPLDVGDDPSTLAVADLNGDGKPDIVVGLDGDYSQHGRTAGVDVLLGNGDGTFKPPIYTPLVGDRVGTVAVADFNGDGKPDVVVTSGYENEPTDLVNVLLGNGDGTFSQQFTYTVANAPNVVFVADLNGDGKPDIVVNDDRHSELTFFLNASTAAATITMSGTVVSANGTGFSSSSSLTYSGGNIVLNIGGQIQSFTKNSVTAIQISLGDGQDSLMIGSGVPVVSVAGGSGGDTVMAANNSNDTLVGGSGNNFLQATGGACILQGGSGQNTLMGGGAGTLIMGKGGTGMLIPQSAGETVKGGTGVDTISATAGGDVLHGGNGKLKVFLTAGGTGSDTIIGGSGLNFAEFNPNDSMTNISQIIDPPKPSVSTAVAPSSIRVGSILAATGATPSAVVNDGVLEISGTPAADTISVTTNAKETKLKVLADGQSLGSFLESSLTGIMISGGAGNDTLSVDPSVNVSATLAGGGGSDSLTGGGGDNVLIGAGGGDTLVGGGGTSLLVPDKFQTYESAATGQDSLVGGSGFAIADFAFRTDNLTLSNNGQLTGGEIISANVAAIWGGVGKNSITGTTGGEFLSGGGAVGDTIHGGGVNDLLVGGKGKDSVIVAAEPVTLYTKNGKADTISGVTNQGEDILEIDTGGLDQLLG